MQDAPIGSEIDKEPDLQLRCIDSDMIPIRIDSNSGGSGPRHVRKSVSRVRRG